jgi:hypothetical protein
MATNWREYLSKIYLDPASPASFQGVDKIYEYVKNEGKYEIGRNRIQKWLNNQDSYSINKHSNKKFKRGRVLVTGIDDQWEADLADVSAYAKENDGYKYLLVVIDVFSRYGWVEPMKNKKATSIVEAFSKIISKERKPRRLRTDGATDFSSGPFKNLLNSFDPKVVHVVTHNEVQANFAERFIKTLKSKLTRYIVQSNQLKYINILSDIVSSYNNTWHSGIKSEPINVSNLNSKRLWWQMYWPKDNVTKDELKLKKDEIKVKKEEIKYKDQQDKKKKKKKSKTFPYYFKIGDKVRISAKKGKFQREYDSKWTGEIFKISERFVRQGQPIYKVVDWFDEPLIGTHYQRELQKVHVDENKTWKIEKIIRRRNKGKELFVKWLFWPNKFNSWIPKSDYKIA